MASPTPRSARAATGVTSTARSCGWPSLTRPRHDAPAFEHHAELPAVDLDGATATVIVGELGGAASPARRDTAHVGAEVVMRPGEVTIALEATWEHALLPLIGQASIEGHAVEPGHLAYLGAGRDEVRIASADGATALLLGGVPFEEPVLMWWNFVARTRDEITQARDEWTARDARFGEVASRLERIPVGPPPWSQEPPR